jgi:hypothetical protein
MSALIHAWEFEEIKKNNAMMNDASPDNIEEILDRYGNNVSLDDLVKKGMDMDYIKKEAVYLIRVKRTLKTTRYYYGIIKKF